MDLVFHLQRGVILRSRKLDDGAVRQCLDAAPYLDTVQDTDLIAANLYVIHHREHTYIFLRSSFFNNSLYISSESAPILYP